MTAIVSAALMEEYQGKLKKNLKTYTSAFKKKLTTMFNPEFYPTPTEVISEMLMNYNLNNKVIFEPSAGKGNIVDYCIGAGAATVLACEKNQDLAEIIKTKCKFIGYDFFEVKAEQISHIDYLVMNPPFSNAEKHILHAYAIAPAGCTIVALCNESMLSNRYSKTREELHTIVNSYGGWFSLGTCFDNAERQTGVSVACINIIKPGENYEEFEGFYLEDEQEPQANGLITYNLVRDLVNRYVSAVKLFDLQLQQAQQMNDLTRGFFSSEIGFNISVEKAPTTRAEFVKDLQKSGWNWIFEKMNMKKHATQGLKQDINKFVEKQQHIPFTMKNIYKMIEIVIGTTGSRMDKAILEVFDRVTRHYDENRYNVPGWKTNSHYLINRRFIVPYCVRTGYNGKMDTCYHSSSNFEMIEDLVKALCYITGNNYDDMISLEGFIRCKFKLKMGSKYVGSYSGQSNDLGFRENEIKSKYPGAEWVAEPVEFGKWFEWGFFRVRGYKKGTLHIEFKDENVWALFNQRVAKLKGYPLYEHTKKEEPTKAEPKEHIPNKPPVTLSDSQLMAIRDKFKQSSLNF